MLDKIELPPYPLSATQQYEFMRECEVMVNDAYEKSEIRMNGNAIYMLVEMLREMVAAQPIFKGWGEVYAGYTDGGRAAIYWWWGNKYKEILIQFPEYERDRVRIHHGHVDHVVMLSNAVIDWLNAVMHAQKGYNLRQCKCGVAWDSILYGRGCKNCHIHNPHIRKNAPQITGLF